MDEIENLQSEIMQLENQILFLAATFARRDASLQAQIAALESANIKLAQQCAWFRGSLEGGSAFGTSAVQ